MCHQFQFWRSSPFYFFGGCYIRMYVWYNPYIPNFDSNQCDFFGARTNNTTLQPEVLIPFSWINRPEHIRALLPRLFCFNQWNPVEHPKNSSANGQTMSKSSHPKMSSKLPSHVKEPCCHPLLKNMKWPISVLLAMVIHAIPADTFGMA